MIDRLDRACGNARGTVYTDSRIDIQHRGAVVTLDAIDRADVDASLIFDADTGFCDHEGHGANDTSSVFP